MATVQWIILKHHKRDDGTYNPKIVITHNRKRAHVSTGIYTNRVRFKRGAQNGVLTDSAVEKTLNEKVDKIRSVINDHNEIISRMEDAIEVRNFVMRKLNPEEVGDFIEFAEKYIKTIKNEGTRYYHQSRMRTFALFIEETRGKAKILATEINSKLVRDYAAWLKSSKRRRGEGYGISDSTIRTYIYALATLFNVAKDKYNDYDSGNIVIKAEPFRTYKPERSEIHKRALSVDQIRSIWEYVPTNKSAEIAKDVFMLSFFLAGMNVADIWECDLVDGRVEYTRKKTRSHKKEAPFLSLSTHPLILPTIMKYTDVTGKRCFGFYNQYAKVASLHQCIHYGMLRIREDLGIEKLTFYAARHSFATIARNDCGISVDDIALCLTHKSTSDITDVYIKKDYKRVDMVINTVVDFVFKQ